MATKTPRPPALGIPYLTAEVERLREERAEMLEALRGAEAIYSAYVTARAGTGSAEAREADFDAAVSATRAIRAILQRSEER